MEMSLKLLNLAVMKKISLILLGSLLLIAAGTDPKQDYIDTYRGIAMSEMARTGIPASITLAQGVLESSSGLSELAVEANNHFGIKCHNDWNGLTYRHDDDQHQECFRAYASAEESFVAHSDFLCGRQRYAALFELDPRDYRGWAEGLSYSGYATDPAYPEKLVKIIEDYRLFELDSLCLLAPVEPADSVEVGTVEAVETELDGEEVIPEEEIAQLSSPKVHYKTTELVLFTLGREVSYVDGAKCLTALPGETYESIAKACGLFNYEIRKYNSVRKGEAPVPGDLVFVERPNKKKAE